jgi:hypothetical protein
MRVDKLRRFLLWALAAVSVLTVFYYSFGVDWPYAYRSRSLLGATFVFCVLGAVGLLPYSLLYVLLRYDVRSWIVPLAEFILVVAPSPVLFLFIWHEGMDGLQYLLVPTVQVVIAGVLFFVFPRKRASADR